jgi:peptide subunit release factor 1 (eRF1)
MNELTEQLSRLSQVQAKDHFVVSCYIRLELRDRVRQRYLTALKSATKPVAEWLEQVEVPHDIRAALERDLERIRDYAARRTNLPGAPGLAIFACEDLQLFEPIPLPRVYRTRVGVGHTPSIQELTAAEEDFGRVVAAVVDRRGARIFEITAFGGRELVDLIDAETRGGKFHSDREDSPGWGEAAFHHRIREEHFRHYAHIARQLAILDGQSPVRGVVLAGPGPDATALARFLSPALRQRLYGTARLNLKQVSVPVVRETVLTLRRQHELEAERAVVTELLKGQGTGWAVAGPRATLRALSRGQVRVLLVRPQLTGWGFRCGTTGRLVIAKADCRDEGTPEPVADLANEAIEEALRQRVTVVAIDDPESGEAIDGMAGLLRFRG